MGTTTTIRASITAIDGEIERLTNARNALANLITDDGVEATPERKRSGRRAAAESTGTKSSSRSTKQSTSRKSRSKNGNGGESRRDQIIALLDQGMSAREIGDELGIAPNYVYHVKRSM